MFFGGLFSYDLVAGFEDLPQLSAENSFADFCFYLAETLMVIDHQKKHHIQASLFARMKKQRLTARLNDLRQQLAETAPPLPVVSVPHMHCECNQSDRRVRWRSAFVAKSDSRRARGGAISPFLSALPVPLAALCDAEKSNPSPYMFLCGIMISPCWRVAGELAPYDATSRQIEITGAEHVHAVVVPMVRWTETSTAASNWKCVPIIKAF